MNTVEVQALIARASREGKDLESLLIEGIQAEKASVEEMVKVQIMPNCYIGGEFGGSPLSIVLMPEGKAVDLAGRGRVSILRTVSDIIKEEDTAKINAHLADILEVRKASDGAGFRTPKKSSMTNMEVSKVKEKLTEEGKIIETDIETDIERKEESINNERRALRRK